MTTWKKQTSNLFYADLDGSQRLVATVLRRDGMTGVLLAHSARVEGEKRGISSKELLEMIKDLRFSQYVEDAVETWWEELMALPEGE